MKTANPETIAILTRLPHHEWRRIKGLANKHRLSMGWVVAKIVREWLSQDPIIELTENDD